MKKTLKEKFLEEMNKHGENWDNVEIFNIKENFLNSKDDYIIFSDIDNYSIYTKNRIYFAVNDIDERVCLNSVSRQPLTKKSLKSLIITEMEKFNDAWDKVIYCTLSNDQLILTDSELRKILNPLDGDPMELGIYTKDRIYINIYLDFEVLKIYSISRDPPKNKL